MADGHRPRSKGKPPPHIEGYLTAKHSSSASFKIKARKYYCVVFGNLIQCFRDEKSYTEKRENVKTQIDLDLVRTITETVSMPASRQKQEYCFKLVFHNDNEIDFIAQSKQDVKNWVECLTQTHKFWEMQKPNEQFEIINKDECDMNGAETNQETAVDVTDEERDPRLIKVSIVMSHGHPYMAYMPPDGNTDDLWATALKSLPGHFCFKCITCQLRRSTMELWSVSKDGVPYKIEKHFNASEYCTTAASPVYLLEHNFKLLVVFFEDSSFLVSPADISTKARDIPDIEMFSRKLAEIDCNNVQLYLKTASGTATPFSQEDAPLRTLWELHGDKWALKPREGEKFLLQSKAILRNNPENIAEKIQQGKLKTIICERNQKKALKRIEYHDCKGKVMKILELPKPSKPLPFDVSLTSGPDMMEDYFAYEPEKKNKHPIQHCTFLPSPEKTTPTQMNAPFCPPDNLDFTPKQIHHEEVTVRRPRSVTDVTPYRTECKTEAHRRVSDSGSLTRKGAFRRKSSYVSLENLIKKDKQEEKNKSRDLSFDNDQENFTHENSADRNLRKAQDVSEEPSLFSSGDKQMSRQQSEIDDQDDQTSVADKILKDNEKLEETNASLPSSGNIVGDDELETELDIEKDVQCDSGIDSFDGSIKNGVEQSDCFDGKEQQHLHSCEYYDVKSPYFLKNILQQYSRLNADEEEVGADHPPRGICLSSIHLLHKDGRWAVESDGELDEDNEEDLEHKEDYEIFKLPGDIKVFFNLNNRTWVVKIIKVENVTTIDEELSNKNEGETTNENSCSMEEEEQLSNGDASSDSSANGNPCSLEEEEDFRCATWKSRYHPLTINHCGQHFRPLDDSYELQQDEPITSQDFTEVKILEDTIQKLFYHMEKYRDLTALDCLDDMKCPDVRKLVCVELCSALERIVSNGLKKKFTLLSAIRYTIWEVVKGTSTDDISSAIVRKINSVGALDDKIRFELFVCECLNQGALASWVETLQNDKKKLHTFYDEKALVMKLPKDTLERLVSRVTFLPFKISFLQYVQKKMKETRDVTQFAFE